MKRYLLRLVVLFWSLHYKLLEKNKKYKNLHKGKTCFIFGNGASLKYYDFSKIPIDYSIATTFGLLDIRMKKLKPKYYIIPDQYNFYSVVRNKRRKGISINIIGRIFKEIIKANPQTTFFISLTNTYSYFATPNNVNYFYTRYRSDIKNNEFIFSNDLCKNFNCTEGSLDIMIGVAKYLGFSKAVLLGCDYLGSPKLEGHFYSDEEPWFGDPVYDDYLKRIKKVSEDIDILAIFPKGIKSTIFNSNSFDEYFDANEKKFFNEEIVNSKDLNLLRKAGIHEQLWMRKPDDEK